MCRTRSGYAALLGDENNAWADGYLTPEEIAADPEAAALAQAVQEQLADQLGVTVDQVQVSGIGGAAPSPTRCLVLCSAAPLCRKISPTWTDSTRGFVRQGGAPDGGCRRAAGWSCRSSTPPTARS